jgi:hypothetical protein
MTASCSRVSTGERACLGPIAASAVVWRLRHFWTVVGLIPWRRASALTLAWLRCIARRTASVVVALPWRTWPIVRPSPAGAEPYHQTPGLNI